MMSKIENVHISEAIAIKLHIKGSFKPCSHLPDNGNFDPLKLAFVKARGGLFLFSERP